MSTLGTIPATREVGDTAGIIIEDDQVPPHRWLLKIKQAGGGSGGGQFILSVLGILSLTRAGGAVGTMAIEVVDLGT